MSLIPDNLKYVDSHEWLRLEDDGTISIGITAHAVDLLGDIIYIELPKVGAQFVEGDTAAVVESVKVASDVYAPIVGEIVAVNEALVDAPETLNDNAYENSWFFRVKPADPNIMSTLMSADDYKKFIEE